MKITDFKTYAVYANYRNWIFVKVFTDEGVYGVGEATMEWNTNSVMGAFEDLRPYVIGNDPRNSEWHFFESYRELYWRNNPSSLSAIAAIDMAMYDITGKYYGMPAYQLLGGKMRDRIKIYGNGWTSGAKTFDGVVANAKKTVENGATALKWDPFGSAYWTISHDELDYVVSLIAAVREAVGPKIDLMIEGHGRFNIQTAVEIAKQIEPYNPFYFEEPVTPDIIEDTVDVHKRVNIPIASGERYYAKFGYRELLEKRGVDYIQPDLVHVGGLTELKKIAAMAEAYNVQVAPHNPNGPVATAANLAMCACLPNVEVLEMLLRDASWRTTVSDEVYHIEDGCIKIPTAPGLGIDIFEDTFKDYPPRHTPQSLFNGMLFNGYGKQNQKDFGID